MFKGLIVFVALALLSRTFSYELQITKALKNAEKLDKKNWIYVDVTKATMSPVDCVESEGDIIAVKVNVPLSFSFSDISVFFANKNKEILQVQLGKTVHGKFYEMPHRVTKQMDDKAPKVTENEKFQEISGTFPKSWLPEKATKISAAVTNEKGEIFNYYGLRNYDVSIPDLLVVEEFAEYKEQ